MIKIYTIGFAQKNAEEFFKLLLENKVTTLFDIRLRHKSQLSGFANARHLPYFLQIHNITYKYLPELAPTKELLDGYKKNILSWETYELGYREILAERQIKYNWQIFHQSVLLCSEATAEKCHRRLCAEFIAQNIDRDMASNIETNISESQIKHL